MKFVFLGLVLGLSGCSLLVSGYNNAPNLLMFLWINPHVDLNAAQEKQTLADLKTVLEWHRQQQLPLYADWLKTMQKLVAEDISAEQVCSLAQSITDSLDPLVDQFEGPLTRLSLTLTTAQLQTLKKKYQQDLKDYRKDWKLDASAEAQLDVQTDKGQSHPRRSASLGTAVAAKQFAHCRSRIRGLFEKTQTPQLRSVCAISQHDHT